MSWLARFCRWCDTPRIFVLSRTRSDGVLLCPVCDVVPERHYPSKETNDPQGG